MRTSKGAHPLGVVRARRRLLVEAGAFIVCAALTSWSAIVTKERGTMGRPLVAVETTPIAETPSVPNRATVLTQDHLLGRTQEPAGTVDPTPIAPAPVLGLQQADQASSIASAEIDPNPDRRWFDGRPVKPVRTIWMTVTGYSPDARSCGRFADGKTATLHSVYTNAMQLVAADPKVLPEGSIISVQGYANTSIVPVLDVGGAIKGNKLDLLFATHAEARRWGVKKIPVTVWAYDDGLPPTNPRKAR